MDVRADNLKPEGRSWPPDGLQVSFSRRSAGMASRTQNPTSGAPGVTTGHPALPQACPCLKAMKTVVVIFTYSPAFEGSVRTSTARLFLRRRRLPTRSGVGGRDGCPQGAEGLAVRKLTMRQACRRHGAVGPVAEVSTQEQCIALHPGSNPGRASKIQTQLGSARKRKKESPEDGRCVSRCRA